MSFLKFALPFHMIVWLYVSEMTSLFPVSSCIVSFQKNLHNKVSVLLVQIHPV